MAETVAFVAGFHDVAVMRQPVQQCRGHLRVAEHTGPFGEVQIRCDRYARMLVLIKRCLDVASRHDDDGTSFHQLVAVGARRDLQIAFNEVDSELLQIAAVCADAEVYPDEQPGKAVIRRSQFLDSALYRDGIQPIFMTLSEEEQLALGNCFMKRLAAEARPDDAAAGVALVVGAIESGERLTKALGLQGNLASMLEADLGRPVARVRDFRAATPLAQSKLQYHE